MKIANRYEVIRALGSGSMGIVYLCKLPDLTDMKVAVKVLFEEVAKDPAALAQFRDEIFAAYSISHPNVIRCYEYSRFGDNAACAMEYAEGGNLADRLTQEISIPEVVRILKELCQGVQAIHDAGLIHRCLKPEDILFDRQGTAKISDFGCARIINQNDKNEFGGVTGSLDYISPEYASSGKEDSRADIYGLGLLGYEMLTGGSPFQGTSVMETMKLRLKSEPNSPRLLRPECPEELAEIILKALQRDPVARFQRASEMAGALPSFH